MNLAGFVSDQVIRSKLHENSKRPSGGIVVYIKSRIAEGTEEIKSDHNDLLWIKLKKSFFDTQNDLYIGVVYIIPSNSSPLNHMSDAYETLGKEISHYSTLGNVLIGGDFNSRLGCKRKDFLVSDSNDFLPIDQTFLLDSQNFRNTKDKVCNTFNTFLQEISFRTLPYCIPNKIRIEC